MTTYSSNFLGIWRNIEIYDPILKNPFGKNTAVTVGSNPDCGNDNECKIVIKQNFSGFSSPLMNLLKDNHKSLLSSSRIASMIMEDIFRVDADVTCFAL